MQLLKDLEGYGIESDIYSLGITICQMGNGFAPFSEMEPLQIIYEKIRGSIPFLLDASNILQFNNSFNNEGKKRISFFFFLFFLTF